MIWFLVTIFAYFFLAVVALFDRYFLVGSIPNPRVYAFNVGILGFLVGLLLIPFGVSFSTLAPLFLLGAGAGFIRVLAILFLAKSIVNSEVSRAVPAIGGFLPIFSFLLFFLFLPSQGTLNLIQLIAFIILILGSVLISLKEFSFKFFSFKNLKNPIIASFFFASAYFLSKLVFLEIDFINGGFLVLFGGGLAAITFLVLPRSKELIFHQKVNQKMSGIFILGQIFGVLGVGALYYAIFLAEPSQVPLINSLEGLRYVFLLIFVFILGIKFPNILKEEISKETLVQKIIAILLIAGGLALLVV